MMLKSWSSIEEVPYCFSRSSVKFQGHKGQISLILSLQFEFADGFEMIYKAWSSIEEVPFCLSRSSMKFQGHAGQKIANFYPNWAFLDCNCSLNTPMGLKWCTKLHVVQKRFPIVFSGSSIKFEGHMDRKIDGLNSILSKITRLVAAIKSLRFALFGMKLIEFLFKFHWCLFLRVKLTMFQHWYR